MQVSEVFTPFPADRHGGNGRDNHHGKRRYHHHEWDWRNRCWRDWDDWR